jgi:aminoglycoside 2''-phosphotransferase
VDELRRIAAAFPDLRWSSARRVTEGWDHVVVILDDALVFRFPLEPHYAALRELETEVLEHLSGLTAARLPRRTHVAPDGSFVGYPLVPGRTLTPEVLAGLGPGETAEVLDQLAAFLSALHTAPLAGTPLERVPPSYLSEDQREVRRAVGVHLRGVLEPQELAEVEEILADVDRLLEADLPRVFLHGDVYSRHLLWDAGARRLGVIDFTDMCLGDPAVDFAELHEYGDDVVRAVHGRWTGPRDPGLLDRAWTYQRWAGVYLMTDHFEVGKTSWAQARATFDRVRRGRRPGG